MVDVLLVFENSPWGFLEVCASVCIPPTVNTGSPFQHSHKHSCQLFSDLAYSKWGKMKSQSF